MDNFKKSLSNFVDSLNKIESIELEDSSDIKNFEEKKEIYTQKTFKNHYDKLVHEIKNLSPKDNELVVAEIKDNLPLLMDSYTEKSVEKLKEITSKILTLSSSLKLDLKEELKFKIINVPDEIAPDLNADCKELEKCFNSECFRASVILCGRILETALHHLYYQKTQTDLLEKSPGIGLGNLIAKLKENNVELDPALAQQVHLINQVRIYSVHKKRESFSPTKDQTHAIILYTLDIIRKLF